ncbi:uncharacterized protein AKAME5_000876100 [Lates japonicus]|uniref:Uncharacterized protein n=1 Tax=Lates japonicus TaxID=270547 RepID=A0AAD3MMB1_LATJO|nr:uncharacterized protein AKAME5_000876100 [Lates japonicus]
MEADLKHADRCMFYGYLLAYWSCFYGHGPGIYTNLTEQEVNEARAGGREKGFLIHIKEHKTNKRFGETQIFLTPESLNLSFDTRKMAGEVAIEDCSSTDACMAMRFFRVKVPVWWMTAQLT